MLVVHSLAEVEIFLAFLEFIFLRTLTFLRLRLRLRPSFSSFQQRAPLALQPSTPPRPQKGVSHIVATMPKDTKGKAAVRGSDAKDAKPYRKRPSSSSSNAAGPSQPNKKPKYEKPQSSNGLPGASKIKASIRQTKRLLAKPNLAPGTKIEAERRLKSLESDLELASRKQVEKSRASRYHRVKFVERQKLVRRIARCKRTLAKLESGEEAEGDSDSDSDGEDQARVKDATSKMSKDELEQMLGELRELLQYVVQYPADLRYVALFPNAEEGPSPPDAKEKDKSRQKAYEHLVRVKSAMKEGKLSTEIEVELSSKDAPRTKLATSSNGKTAGQTTDKKADKKSKKTDKSKRKQAESSDEEDDEDVGGVKGDDFFAQSDDEE